MADPSAVKKKMASCSALKLFMASLTFAYICKALSGTVMKSSITQIERRFDTTSSMVGLIDGSFEIGNLLVIAFVSHFGAKLHRPKIISIGCFIMGLGSVLTALPHFFMGFYKYGQEVVHSDNSSFSACTTELPSTSNDTMPTLLHSDCRRESGSNMWIYVLMGNMIRGIGETPITPLGISYIDDFSKEENSALHIAILHTMTMIGPMVGYLLGSLCARMYVDIGFVDLNKITITPKDSRWVGAWWLGFLIAGFLSILASIPFCFLPKSAQKKGRQESNTSASPVGTGSNGGENQALNVKSQPPAKGKGHLTGFFYSLKLLLSNELYLIYMVLSLLQFSAFVGSVTYVPKYLEQQYGQSISKSNFLIGVITLPTVSCGIFTGGFIVKKYKLNLEGIVKLALLGHCFAFLLQILYFALGCENKTVAGLTVPYGRNDSADAPQDILPFSLCNNECNCDVNQWDPVCGNNGITYMSPCLAGCKSSVGYGKNMVFHNCSCVAGIGFHPANFSAHQGECSRTQHCSRNFIYYMVVQVLASFFFALGSTPSFMLIFRNVEPELKSLAVGVHFLIQRSLGGILSPIYFGALIDKTCVKWSINSCGERGACRIYDNVSYKTTYISLVTGLKSPTAFLYILLLLAMRRRMRRKGVTPSENKEEAVLEPIQDNIKSNQQSFTYNDANSETVI
ncbi:solute carrier organic anion transporter family member 1B3-like [Tachyglossus aculeatus]|uniref:solute carrier organic anion transporter family member 1B3-like n=1 Tax=Tachyglossus aculeatus TaxID=9261 RepID=UPI0018F467A6|nr:solute carrier organic anion transporter family member 1B3-like [Tachyglossus aculeatus]XP_038597490.1 solute carrier organic anion transporter family member 1B3-like [Tachyglossus aculeatus]XP_038597497.1 solute carrier organic anion transporter family member 1B3-like [Tachyglossus aculeatus]